MNLEELKPTLVVLGPVFGLIGTITVIAGRLLWVYLGHLKERIVQLELDKKNLEADVEAEKARAKGAEFERDHAVQKKQEAEDAVAPLMKENFQLKQEATEFETKIANVRAGAEKHKQDADRYLTAAHQQKAKRTEAETRAEKAETDVKTANARVTKLEGDLKLTVETAKKRISDTELAVTTANKLRAEADKRTGEAKAEATRYASITAALEKQIEAVANQDGRVWQAPLRPGTPPFVPLSTRSTPIISLLNLKGGVGKTTLTANLAGYLSEHLEKRVLVIDLDHQRSLSQLLLSPKERELAADAGHTIQRFFRDKTKDGTALLDCSRPVPGLSGVRIITNTDPRGKDGQDDSQTLDDLEMRLMSAWLILPRAADVRFLLLPALQSPTIRSQFDYVLIDCPPRLTTACINALVGSDY
jgi:Flp pilus assembly CpaE family ATPase